MPESILDFVIPFLTSDMVDSSDYQTVHVYVCGQFSVNQCSCIYFNVDFSVAATLCNSSVQYLFTADLICSCQFSSDVRLFLRLRRCI